MIALVSRVGAAALAVSVVLSAVPAAIADHPRDSERLIVNCASSGYGSRVCPMPSGGRVLEARLVRRFSDADCDRGEDWGVRDDALWVSHGCRADFEVLLVRSNIYRDDDLAGGPGHPPHVRRDGRGGDWREPYGRAPDFQTVQRACSRAAIEEAWRLGFYSAQYHNGPRLEEGRYGYEMRGQVRLHDRKGFHYWESACDIDRGQVTGFRYLR